MFKRFLIVVTALSALLAFYSFDLAFAAQKWNTREVDVLKNGNISVALSTIKNHPNYKTECFEPNLKQVFKKPWEFYGTPIVVSGVISYLEDFPPGSDVCTMLASDQSCDIVVIAQDEVFEMWTMRSSGNLETGDSVRLFGYVIGRMEVPNQFGGTSTHVILVGNTYD